MYVISLQLPNSRVDQGAAQGKYLLKQDAETSFNKPFQHDRPCRVSLPSGKASRHAQHVELHWRKEEKSLLYRQALQHDVSARRVSYE